MQWRPNPLTNVETTEPLAALTFDDGPHPLYTPQVLSTLRHHGAKATFFMVGESAHRYPRIVEEVANAGHAIGNHSWSHPYLPNMRSRFGRLKQLWNCARATKPHCQRLFRPPFGAQNAQIMFDAFLFRYRVVLWNASAQDWDLQQPNEITQKIVNRVTPGCIFLLHDAIHSESKVPDEVSDRASMIEGLDAALSLLKSQMRFVTVSELLQRGRPVSNWPTPSPS